MLTERERATTRGVIMGRSLPSIDGVAKVTGRAQYLYDFSLPNMLYGKLKRSEFPHARIRKIEKRRAEKLRGVKAVIIGDDLPATLVGKGVKDTPIIARGKVRYLGEPIAIIVAENEALAEEAADLISVEYDELPAIYDPIESASEDPPVVIHEDLQRYERDRSGPYAAGLCLGRPNVNSYARIVNGDVEKAMAKADFIVENEYRTGRVHHYHVEPSSCVARPDEEGGVTIYTGSQDVFKIRSVVAEALSLPESSVRVIVPKHVGGAFGNRDSGILEAICAAASLKVGRPVKIRLSREDLMTTTTSRHPAVIRIKDGITKDGWIIARDVKIFLSGGAYTTEGITAVPNSARAAISTYSIPNISVEVFRTYTNEMEGGAMRAFGYTYTIFAIESQMDAIAQRLGEQPDVIRLRHMLRPGQRNAAGELPDRGEVDTCLVAALQEAKNIEHTQDKLSGSWLYGRGIAVGHKGIYGNFPTMAYVRYNHDDTIDVVAGVFEVGQGARTAITQIVSDFFDHPINKIKLSELISDILPPSSGAAGSRQTFLLGNAVLMACEDCRRAILSSASELLGVDLTKLSISDRHVVDRETGERLLAIRDLFSRGPAGGYFVERTAEFIGRGFFHYQTSKIDFESGKCKGDECVALYTPVAVVSDVMVEKETGRVKILGLTVATDAGRIINKAMIEGQIYGCIIQGVGTALFEELITEHGKVLNADNKDYKVPLIYDVPIETRCIILETPVRDVPLGVRGCGEAVLAVVPAAIANAICAAIKKRIYSLPCTSEKILMALRGIAV